MIIGVDEVGRGAWAGPLVVGAVALGEEVKGLKDSKLLSKHTRENLDKQIRASAQFVGLGWVEPKEIDDVGLSRALVLATERALIGAPDVEIIIDGNINFLPSNPKARCLINADDTEPAVSAASIVAKVARDNYMAEQALYFPDFGFEKHVGYGTQLHIEAIKLLGACDIHRLSYKPVRIHGAS